MTSSGTRGVLNDTLSIYFGDMTLASETVWRNLAVSRPPSYGTSKIISLHANIDTHNSDWWPGLFTGNMSEKRQGFETMSAANCFMDRLSPVRKSKLDQTITGYSLFFRQTGKNPRNVQSSQPAISSFNRVIHYFGGLLWRTVQSRASLTIF
jgi:hypothetical protein